MKALQDYEDHCAEEYLGRIAGNSITDESKSPRAFDSQNGLLTLHQVWAHVRAVYEPIIVENFVRDAHRASASLDKRRSVIQDVYDGYKRTLPPIEWLRLPPLDVVCMMPAFRRLVCQDRNIPLTQAQCDEAVTTLPSAITAYQLSIKVALLRAMGETVEIEGRVIKWPADADDRLGLASSVFLFIDHCLSSADTVYAQLSDLGIPYKRFRDYYGVTIRVQNVQYHGASSKLPR